MLQGVYIFYYVKWTADGIAGSVRWPVEQEILGWCESCMASVK